jgi:TetR/AcrR family transcriptional regulator, regulator of autoinduction and epiphytic fitness
VYFTFHTKFAVFREAFDFAVVGSVVAVSPHRQPWFEPVRGAEDLRTALHALVAGFTHIARRVAPIAEAQWGMGNDPEAVSFYRDRERLRHEGYAEILEVLTAKSDLRPGLDRKAALDILFVLLSPELYKAMVMGRGWSEDAWESWVARTLEESLFAPSEGVATREVPGHNS